jgi:uncharacterized damage-inducible protein DinB
VLVQKGSAAMWPSNSFVEGTMRNVIVFALLLGSAVLGAAETTTTAAGEYAKHFGPLKDLTVAVAQAMPIEHWAFRPHPESMNFGMLMSHIATTNYQFCAGLMDSDPPQLKGASDRDAIVKMLRDSFDYCLGVIEQLTDQQLAATHNTPDGRLTGRETLLAMYIHVAHHRGQAEIYLRANEIKPPGYRI